MLDVVRAVRARTVALDLAREREQEQQPPTQQQPGRCCNDSDTNTMASPSDGPSALASSLPAPPAEALAKSAGRGLAVALSLGELPSEIYQVGTYVIHVCVNVLTCVMWTQNLHRQPPHINQTLPTNPHTPRPSSTPARTGTCSGLRRATPSSILSCTRPPTPGRTGAAASRSCSASGSRSVYLLCSGADVSSITFFLHAPS